MTAPPSPGIMQAPVMPPQTPPVAPPTIAPASWTSSLLPFAYLPTAAPAIPPEMNKQNVYTASLWSPCLEEKNAPIALILPIDGSMVLRV